MANRRDAAKFDAMRSLASDAVTATYADLGAVLDENALIVTLHNGSDKLMIVSVDDGVTDFMQLPPATFKPLDLGAANIGAKGGIQIQVKLNVAGAATAGALVTAEVISLETPSLL